MNSNIASGEEKGEGRGGALGIISRKRSTRTYNVDFTTVGPNIAVGLPCSGPCSTALWHVTDIEAAKRGALGLSMCTDHAPQWVDIHCDMGGVGLVALYTDTAASWSAGREYCRVVSTQDECVARREGQILRDCGRLVDIVANE